MDGLETKIEEAQKEAKIRPTLEPTMRLRFNGCRNNRLQQCWVDKSTGIERWLDIRTVYPKDGGR